MVERERDFLSRWARLKKEAKESKEQEVHPANTGESEDAPSDADVEKTELAALKTEEQEQIEKEFENVDYSELDYGSDYTRFMKDGVPEMVRRRALRQLWKSDPILANLDGLNEYDEDYTDAALAVKALSSAWKPGKGYEDEDVEEGEKEVSTGQQQQAQQAQEADQKTETEEEAETGSLEDDVEIAEEQSTRDETGEDQEQHS